MKLTALIACGTLLAVPGRAATPQDRGFERERPRRELKHLEGHPAPPLFVDDWINAPAGGLDWSDLEGKVVLVDFWGTWCSPCIRALPHLRELHERYPDDLVILGIHATRGAARMAEFAQRAELPWPLAADQRQKTQDRFGVDGFPDYFLIDRQGVLRMADLRASALDRALAYLIREGQPAVPLDELRAWIAARPTAVLEDEERGARLELELALSEARKGAEGGAVPGRVILTETWTDADRTRRRIVSESTLDEPLAPVRLAVRVESPDGSQRTAEASLDDRRFVGQRVTNGTEEPIEIALDARALSASSFWLAGLVAPREPGAKLSVQLVDVLESNLKLGIFTCEGADSVSLGEREVACTRYELRRFGQPRAHYWIDGGGHVVRYETRGVRLVRREATATDE